MVVACTLLHPNGIEKCGAYTILDYIHIKVSNKSSNCEEKNVFDNGAKQLLIVNVFSIVTKSNKARFVLQNLSSS